MKKDKDNTDLHTAKSNKADEFYTMYSDIEAEMKLYDFTGKIIYCPCDCLTTSNFCRYFKNNFKELGLKKFISFFYNPGHSYYNIYDGENEDIVEIHTSDAGDFRSEQSKELMKLADVIVTNPPFSLFRDFIAQVIEYNKEYIVLGNVNAITYKEVFHHIVDKEMWLGGTIHSGDRKFYIPDDYPLEGTSCGVDEYGKRYIRVKGVRWFTNMKYKPVELKRNTLTMNYFGNEDYYPTYDTYSTAINVNSMKEIPNDYLGVIGAPITVLDKMNHLSSLIEFYDDSNHIIKFELLGQLNSGNNAINNYDFAKPIINGKCKFKRLLIARVI